MTSKAKNDLQPTSDDEILKLARDRFQSAQEAETELRKNFVDDMKFRAGEQWPDEIKNSRNLDKRPCLTINRIPQFLRQVTNELRQNRPSIKVNPINDKASVETAEVIQGMIRNIEYQSNSDVAYDRAVDGQCTGGFGFLRVITQYCDEMSFKQDLRIVSIRDPLSVSMDPSYKEPDGSDANFVFIEEEYSKEEFKHLFPDADAEMASVDNTWKMYATQAPGWFHEKGCRVVEYFVREWKEKTICLLSNGEVKTKEEIGDLYDQMKSGAPAVDEQSPVAPADGSMPAPVPEQLRIVQERSSQVPVILWYKMTGTMVLERTEWLGKWIPVIPVLGDEMILEGKRILEGVVRHAKDPQRMYNFWSSAETEMIALAPKAPFIAAEGQLEGHEKQWQTSNVRNHPFLYYKPKTLGGVPLPPPQRNYVEPPVQSIVQARMASSEDLKATTGIYDAALGNRSNEQSGIAIQRRTSQSETANFHLADNLKRSIRHLGRILVDMIPKIYDEEQAVHIIHPDDEKEVVFINKMFEKKGKQVGYFLDMGTYDATIDSGPNFQTKRQEAVASMLDLTKAVPQSMQYALDLLVRNMDWPYATEIADRIKRTLPPGIVEQDGQDPVPPQAQQMISQLQQVNQALTEQLHKSTDIINTKKVEFAAKERIEILKMENELVLQQMQNDATHAKTAFEAEVSMLQQRLKMLPLETDLNTTAQNPVSAQNPPSGLPAGQPQPGQNLE